MIKKISITGCFLLRIIFCSAQSKTVIEVGSQKTTYIEFKGIIIKSNSIGNESIGQQLNNGILQLRAKETFKETNMLIIAADSLIEFTLRYNPSPAKTLYQFNYSQPVTQVKEASASKSYSPLEQKPVKDNNAKNETLTVQRAFSKLTAQKVRYGIGMANAQMKIVCNKIYCDDEYIYISFLFSNSINMEYKVDGVKYVVVTRKKLFNKSQVRNNYLEALEDKRNPTFIVNKSPITLNYALKKFALRDDEQLVVNFYEQTTSSRGRNLTIKINANVLNMAGKME